MATLSVVSIPGSSTVPHPYEDASDSTKQATQARRALTPQGVCHEARINNDTNPEKMFEVRSTEMNRT